MRHRSLLVVLVLLFVAAAPVFAGHSWSNYHWPRSCGTCEASIEVRRSLTVTATANWPDHAYKAVFGDPNNPNTANRRGWNDSEVLALNVTNGSSDASYRQPCPKIDKAIRVCNYAYGANGWAGLAQVWPDASGHITGATTKVNDTYYTSNNDPWERHVMCQEVGHDFGLGHTSEDGSSQNTCMDYYKNSTTNWTSTGPNQHDFDQLRTQHHYGLMTDPVAMYSRWGSGITDEGLNEPWQWGTPIEWDREGRAITYKLQVNENESVITFVTWAPREEERDREMERSK